MFLSLMTPPMLTLGVPTPMFLLSSERVGALVGLTIFWRMAINGVSIVIMHRLLVFSSLVIFLLWCLIIWFVFVGPKKHCTLFLGGVPVTFTLQVPFGVLSLD